MQVHTSQAKSRRNESTSPFAVRAEGLSVFVQFRVKAARAPARKDFLESLDIYT